MKDINKKAKDVKKVSCPFCKARFKWMHLHRAEKGKRDFCITREYVINYNQRKKKKT